MNSSSLRIRLAALACLPLAAAGHVSAATIINFGLEANATPASGVTFNNVATVSGGGSTFAVGLNDQDGNATGITIASTGGNWAAMGAGGSFNPVGTPAYAGGSTVADSWVTGYQSAYGNLWQGGANSDGTQTRGITFSGLAANTTYQLTLLSVRANGFITGDGTYSLTYDGSAEGIAANLFGAGSLADSTVTGAAGGDANGLNAREITWTFTTGENPADAVLDLEGQWNVNAIIIDVIPEPSTALLGGLGLIALMRRRRD